MKLPEEVTLALVHTTDGLDAETLDDVGYVLDLNVLSHGILAKVFAERVNVFIVHINPVLGIFLALVRKNGFHDERIKHGLALDVQK